jgi:hypothetical protein
LRQKFRFALNAQKSVPRRASRHTLDRLGGHRRLELGIKAADDIGNRFCADQILFANLEAELFFQVHDELETIKAADAEVVNQQSIIPDQPGFKQEGFRQDFSNSAAGVQ